MMIVEREREEEEEVRPLSSLFDCVWIGWVGVRASCEEIPWMGVLIVVYLIE
jgi:hypothetical protein